MIIDLTPITDSKTLKIRAGKDTAYFTIFFDSFYKLYVINIYDLDGAVRVGRVLSSGMNHYYNVNNRISLVRTGSSVEVKPNEA